MCLSQTWLSQEDTRLATVPLNLTVPVHLGCTPHITLAVTAGYSLSRVDTIRWDESHTVFSLWWPAHSRGCWRCFWAGNLDLNLIIKDLKKKQLMFVISLCVENGKMCFHMFFFCPNDHFLFFHFYWPESTPLMPVYLVIIKGLLLSIPGYHLRVW